MSLGSPGLHPPLGRWAVLPVLCLSVTGCPRGAARAAPHLRGPDCPPPREDSGTGPPELWQQRAEASSLPAIKNRREMSPLPTRHQLRCKEAEALGGAPCAPGCVVGGAVWGLTPQPYSLSDHVLHPNSFVLWSVSSPSFSSKVGFLKQQFGYFKLRLLCLVDSFSGPSPSANLAERRRPFYWPLLTLELAPALSLGYLRPQPPTA